MTVRTAKPKSYTDYSVDPDMPLNHRLATYLDWVAFHFPGRFVPYQHAAKVILIRPKLPGPDSSEVRTLKGAMPRARKLLLSHYKRGLISKSGVGIRATTDSEDTARFQVERDAKRVAQAVESLDRSTSAVTASEIKDPTLKKRFVKITKTTKMLVSPDVLGQLRLPAPKDAD